MDRVRFNENLAPHIGGFGLLGFCSAAFWHYERHAPGCAPGKWHVSVGGHESGEFWTLLTRSADAVVDDFGNLVPVGVQ